MIISNIEIPFFIKHLPLILLSFLPVILYAEIHYRLPFLKGLLYKNQPEILFDMPFRVQSNYIPILLLIKDCHQFPVLIQKVQIDIKNAANHSSLYKESINENLNLSKKWFYKIYHIDVSKFKGIDLEIECRIVIVTGKKEVLVINDNLPTLSHKNFLIFADPEPIPFPNSWKLGDLHCHSSWTEDQVEYGPPPAIFPIMAKAMGLSFCGLMDHSYDLDDLPGFWTKNDPDLQKWADFQKTITELNQKHPNFLLIPGEEASVDNGFGKTVHLGILNSKEFFIGTGDGLENGMGKLTEYYYANILNSLAENTLAVAAHPQANPPFLHRLVIKRGTWNKLDHHRNLAGFQIMNGTQGQDLQFGKEEWIKQLLKGRKKYIYAGNDSHGSFNRFRALLLPMLKLFENQIQIFGKQFTAVKTSKINQKENVINDLKNGEVVVSTGPFICLEIIQDGKIISDRELKQIPQKINIKTKSTKYFGKIKTIKLIQGNIHNTEKIIFKANPENYSSKEISITRFDLPHKSYIRAEVYTDNGNFAMTNPVWVAI